MNTTSILIVDDNCRTLEMLRHTLDESQATYEICSSSHDAWNVVRTNPQITAVVIRMNGANISGCMLCERIREVKSADHLPVLMIVAEDQLEHAALALDAGANDILIDPFEARELRMRLGLSSVLHRCRVDEAHFVGDGGTAESSPSTVIKDSPESFRRSSELVIPQFNPVAMKFTYGATDRQVATWQDDETVTKVPLDQIMVCPCCESIPTFRPGCSECGSAWTRPESLLHHYACAHIGLQSEFQTDGGLMCPKCRQTQLVAGADFEVVPGSYVCDDCGTHSSEPTLIGHCLSCQHRFPAHLAKMKQLTGFHVHRVQEVIVPEESRRVKAGFKKEKAASGK